MTSEEAEKQAKNHVMSYIKQMWINIICGIFTILVAMGSKGFLGAILGSLLGFIWVLAPIVMWHISKQKKETPAIEKLDKLEKEYMLELGEKTWAFFKKYIQKENNYLIILLRIFMKDRKFSTHISSDDMIELEQIDCKNDYNKLAIYLLKLCNSEDKNLEKLIESIVNLKIHKKILYSVVSNILRNCEINNRDKVWTLVYFHLEQEDFEGQKELLNGMIDNMIEIKGNS